MIEFASVQVPGFVITLAAFLLSVGVLIIVHEWGHYIMAKRGGVPVEEFSIGWGPVIARMGVREETTFNLRAIPIGGFVRMTGMEPGDDTEGGYNSKPMFTRAKIISAGVIVNILFGFLLFVVLGLSVGLPREDAAIVNVGQVSRGSAAEQAGLKEGDRILTVNGKAVSDPTVLTDSIRAHAGQRIVLTVSRQGQNLRLVAVPVAERSGGTVIGRLGFIVSPDAIWERHGLLDSISAGGRRTWAMAHGIVKVIFRTDTWRHGQVGGPIAIAKEAGGTAEKGPRYFALFVAMLSINLGVLNLLPIPALDGGHILLLLVEAVRGKRLPARTALVVQGLGFALLLVFIGYATVIDLMRLHQS